MKSNANLCGLRWYGAHGNWGDMYVHIALALNELGYDVRKSPFLEFPRAPDFVSEGIEDNKDDVYIYNHTYTEDIVRKGVYRGEKCLFIKPTGPTSKHFTIDTQGYGPYCSITYKRPPLESVRGTDEFFQNHVQKWIDTKENKWSDRAEYKSSDIPVHVPDNHILVLGQMPGDETVLQMSFGDHWIKFCTLVNELLHQSRPVVVKVHPTLRSEILEGGHPEEWLKFDKQILEWEKKGVTVFTGKESIHSILPHTRTAVVENSTAGIECALHNVPTISYGYPEYHWITFDLRHVRQLNHAVEDLSWYNRSLARNWVTWFCRDYQCYSYESTLRRLKFLLDKFT